MKEPVQRSEMSTDAGVAQAPPDDPGSPRLGDDPDATQALQDRIQRLEESTDIEFIRRESRFIPAVVNFWQYFRFGRRADDPRSRASLTALLWRVFSPGTAAAAGGVMVMLLTAVQAVLIYQQNQKLDQQTYLAEASRRGVLTAEFSSLAEKVGGERTARIAAQEVLPWKRFKVDAVHFRLESPTAARLSAFTRSAKPYRYLDLEGDTGAGEGGGASQGWAARLYTGIFHDDAEPKLNAAALSPERGQALSFLSTTNVDLTEASSWGFDFSNADLRRVQLVGTRARTAKLPNADLSGSTLLAVDLQSADLRGAVLRNVCWQEGDLSLAKIKGADLRGAYLNDVALPLTQDLATVRIDETTHLEGSYSFHEKWLDAAKSAIAPELRRHLDRYTVARIERTFTTYDFDGREHPPQTRTIYVLRSPSAPARPAACELLPGA